MKVKVYAKLNLTLDVGEKVDEYHSIDSVATSVDVYDVVEVTNRSDKQVIVNGTPTVEQERNTAYRAACAFVEAFDTCGVDISIDKGIPFGGGLGGSSADAAAVLFCLASMQKIDMGCGKLLKICETVGSDITFMLHGGLGRLRGKGDLVDFFLLKNPIYFALTTFTQELRSGEVYRMYDKLTHGRQNDAKIQQYASANEQILTFLQNGINERATTYFGNDLQQATMIISNYAEQYLSFSKAHALSPILTGSGSAYFIAFSDCAEAEKTVQLLNFNGFNTILCHSVSKGIEIIE